MTTPDRVPSEPQRQRKPYRKPELVHYGDVAQLTHGGTTGTLESSCPGAPSPGQPTKKSCPSDRRLKHNIVQVGTHPQGFGLYLFDYLPSYQGCFGSGRQFGVMADEVRDVRPDAVVTRADGFAAVDYEAIGISRADRLPAVS